MLHQIGVGALGPVFRAFDPERDRLVAVKRFQLDVPPERMHELVAMFERLIAAQLTHPALAAPVATGIDGTAAYLAMDYVLGDSLDIAVRDYGPAPPVEALRVATQLAGALDFAAVVNVEHGALHPRDVLLSSEETRITGLGVARALETIGVAAPARRPYSAPERHVGPVWDRRADIFSLAALIHELLWARRIAGAGSRAAEALTEIPGGDLPALRDVFARALATAPTDRFGTALEFADALKAALPDVALFPGQPATGKRQRRPSLPLLDNDADLPIAPPDKSLIDATTKIDADSTRGAKTAPILIDEAADAGELDLRQAEAERYQDVETAPAVVEPLPTPRREPSPDFVDTRPEFMASAIEQSRSAVWPLVLALIVGVAMGFAGGYGVGSRDRTAPSASGAPPPPAATQSPAPAGNDSTEVAVAEPQKTKPVGSTGGVDVPPAAPVTPPKPPAPPEKRETAKTEPARPEPSKPESAAGRLLVRSSPAGARVFVDGHEYGKTPLAVRDLARGSHRVRIVREGYGTEERRIVLTAARPAQSMTVPLERDRAQIAQARKPAVDSKADTPATTGGFSGPLTVESRPTGANVYLDGKLVGTTPLQLPEVAAGEHAVRLEHDGYRLWSSSVRVIATEKNRITASLER